MLYIYNTLTKTKELFSSNKPNLINIYICGVTIYDLCHLGHGRTFVAFDIIIRYLRLCGYKVNYIRNITDIEDKIIYKALKAGSQSKFLSKTLLTEMHKDFKAITILAPNHEPCTTKNIRTIIEYVHMLVKKRYAYLNTNGEVIYSVNSTKNYGLLSRQKANYLNVNRIKALNNKRSFNDFVLWKRTINGEPVWRSPWDYGRPGWHIECSAINNKYLDSSFDIHGGGLDLIFPHHENERTQATSAFDGPHANIWIHAGMLIINNEKMSKSLNNSIKLREALKYYDAETIRTLYLSSHYRSPLVFSIRKIKESYISLKRLYTALRGSRFILKADLIDLKEDMVYMFFNAMNDDFNTPKAFSILYYIAKKIGYYKHRSLILTTNLASSLRQLGNLLGLLSYDSIGFIHENPTYKPKTKVKDIINLIKKRNLARSNKQWLLADNIRAKINDKDIVLEDGKELSIWRLNYIL